MTMLKNRRLTNILYISVFFLATLTSSLIWNQTAPIVDEILISIVAIFAFSSAARNHQIRRIKIYGFRLELITLFYLFLNSLLSFFTNPSTSQIRFLLIYLTFFLLILSLFQEPLSIPQLFRLSNTGFIIYLFFWIMYWIILITLKIDWAEQQSKTLAGSVYSAFIPLVGLYLSAYSYLICSSKITNTVFWINYCLTIIAAGLYDTRALLLSVLIITLILMIYKKSIRFFFTIILIFASATLAGNYIGTFSLPESKNVYKSSLTQLKSIPESTRLIDHPKVNDEDRSFQIKCATQLIFMKSDIPRALFGYGQNQHKTILLECYGIERDAPSAPVRPIGYAAFLSDFGLLGLFLIFSIFIKKGSQLFSMRGGSILATLYFLVFAWAFITNYLDHGLVLMILFLNYLKFYAESTQSA